MTQTKGTIRRDLLATLKYIDLPQIIRHQSLGVPKKGLKRSANELIDDTITHVSGLSYISNPSFITLSDTSIATTYKLTPEESSNLPIGEIFRQEITVLHKKSTLEIKSKKRFKIKETLLATFEFESDFDVSSLSADIKLLKSTKVKNSEYIKYDQPLQLIVHRSKGASNLVLILCYKYSLVQSIFLEFSSEFRKSLQIVLDNLVIQKTSSNPHVTIDNKLFYSSITQHAIDYPQGQRPPLVPELDSELLNFQGKTVNWMLSREHATYNEDTLSVEQTPKELSNYNDSYIRSRLDEFSFGFELVHLENDNSEPVWFNKYTYNLVSKQKAIEYLNTLEIPGGIGLLCEEMGLGKTIEVISLTLLNLRPEAQLSESYPDSIGRKIQKVKSSLIICPESIIQQWVDEAGIHAPSLKVMIYKGLSSHEVPIYTPEINKPIKYRQMSPNELIEELSSHDIVLTTYSILSREIYNASYNPERSKRLRQNVSGPLLVKPEDYDQEVAPIIEELVNDFNEAKSYNNLRYDQSSPLISLEFWRVILDESQMIGRDASNKTKISTLIPRHHSWAVSGTPIKNDVSDLYSSLLYLKFKPFSHDKAAWKTLLESHSDDFIRLSKLLAFRHTKEIVKNEIKLPGQRRMLMSIPFSAIEQNNYDELYKKFLRDVGLDDNGVPIVEDWEPSPSYYETMRHWLRVLRSACCHASLDAEETDERTLSKFKTLEAVLQRMISQEKDKIIQLEREKSLTRLEIGQIFEYIKKPKSALEVWSQELENLQTKVNNMRNEKDTSPTFRSFLELLHRAHFFVASAYYQLYNPPSTNLDDGLLVYRVLTEQEANYQSLETHHYTVAQIIRKQILSESIKNIKNSVDKLSNEFQIPYIPMKEHFKFDNIDSQVFHSRVNSLFVTLNEQAILLNKYLSHLLKLLLIPLLDTVTDPSGEEYIHSLDEQYDCSVYMEVIQEAMIWRDLIVLGRGHGQYYEPILNLNEKTSNRAEVIDDLKTKLAKDLPNTNFPYCLKSLLIDSKTLISKYEDNHHSNEYKFLSNLIFRLKEHFEEQKTTCDDFKKIFRTFNDSYNLKITYFRQLQELSDNVAPFDDLTHGNYNIKNKLANLSSDQTKAESRVQEIKSRVRYLETLSNDYNPDESEKNCIICRSSITIGSLLKCGHKYCKDCLDVWLKNKSQCPICKQRVIKSDIYNFTFNRDDIDVTVNVEHQGDRDKEIAEIYEKSEKQSLKALNQIPLRANYGSKVDTIVRQILWLKRQDTSVQVVIYSQWAKLLAIISRALKQNGILFVGSGQSLSQSVKLVKGRKPSTQDISAFKKNPRITCFLLNAKADASGLNLINATHVFICEPLVQTALESQAISRIHRIGQLKPTTIWMFSISGSVEENIVLLASRKRNKEKEKLETEEKAQSSKSLVEKSGEHVNTDDLWNSFFSMKTDHFV